MSDMQATTHPDIGAAIRAEMGRQRITMSALAEKTGTPRTTLAYQINENCVTGHNLIKIADALNVKIDQLRGARA